tara:strand:+ start:403 stop:597 length:195 start_codon:yes stop_codon:yes gene_type:complete
VLRKIVKDFIRFLNHEENIGRHSPLIPPAKGGQRGMAIHLLPVIGGCLSIFLAASTYYASIRTF